MTRSTHDSRQLQRDFDNLWTSYEKLTGRPLEADEIEEMAEFLIDE